ncbi:MAG: BA14K family protein [Phyllobacterium sp.]
MTKLVTFLFAASASLVAGAAIASPLTAAHSVLLAAGQPDVQAVQYYRYGDGPTVELRLGSEPRYRYEEYDDDDDDDWRERRWQRRHDRYERHWDRPPPLRRREVRRSYGNAHVQWCYNRYRSYRAYDNTFQPYGGPRQYCYSPYR